MRYTDELPATADIVVVGGGVVGCASAFYAARAGLKALVVERRPRLATLTTAVSTGAFRLQFDNRDEIELVREGVELFESFAERTGLDGWDLGLRRSGYLFCALTEDGVEHGRRLVDRQRTWGLTDVELLRGDEARRRFPYLSHAVIEARYRARDGWLDPRRLTLGFATAASHPEGIPDSEGAGGVSFAVGTAVTGLERAAGTASVRVVTDRGSIDAGHVVLAGGPFLAELAALAGVRIDLRPTRRQKLVFPVLPDVPRDAPMTIEAETAAHWRPALGGGCFCLWTEAGTPFGPPLEDVPTETAWSFGLLDPASPHALARVAPFWERVWERGTDHWYLQAGQYEYTPDRRPYIGPTEVPGISLNGGYSGHGIMASPGGSRRAIDLLLGHLDRAANPFRPERPMAGRELDVL